MSKFNTPKLVKEKSLLKFIVPMADHKNPTASLMAWSNFQICICAFIFNIKPLVSGTKSNWSSVNRLMYTLPLGKIDGIPTVRSYKIGHVEIFPGCLTNITLVICTNSQKFIGSTTYKF